MRRGRFARIGLVRTSSRLGRLLRLVRGCGCFLSTGDYGDGDSSFTGLIRFAVRDTL